MKRMRVLTGMRWLFFKLRGLLQKQTPGAVARERLRQFRREQRPSRWNVTPSGSWEIGALRKESQLDALESGALFIPFSGSQSAAPRVAPQFGKTAIRPAEFMTGDPAMETDSRS